MAKEKLAVVEDVVEADPIEVAFTAATESGKEGDDVKRERIKAGAAFKSVTNLFNKFMVSSGKAMSVDQKKELLASYDKSENDERWKNDRQYLFTVPGMHFGAAHPKNNSDESLNNQ